jgi:hypothetical protein
MRPSEYGRRGLADGARQDKSKVEVRSESTTPQLDVRQMVVSLLGAEPFSPQPSS